MNESVKKNLKYLLLKILLFTLLLCMTFGFVFGIRRNTGNDMYSSLKNGDLVLYYRMQKQYSAQDVIVLKDQILRIVACPGDRVDLDTDGLHINGYLQQETNTRGTTLPYKNETKFPIQLKSDEYFLLGDNRDNAKDSRVFGVVNSSDIKGKVIMLLRRSDL